jgi:hypothetical protein
MEPAHKENLCLAKNFYSPADLESLGSKLQVPVWNRSCLPMGEGDDISLFCSSIIDRFHHTFLHNCFTDHCSPVLLQTMPSYILEVLKEIDFLSSLWLMSGRGGSFIKNPVYSANPNATCQSDISWKKKKKRGFKSDTDIQKKEQAVREKFVKSQI